MAHSVVENKEYWDDFYRNLSLSVPSQFCAMVALELPAGSTVVELGCGNGRDSLYMASRGSRVVAIDLSEQAVARCTADAKVQGIEHVSFLAGSLASKNDIASLYQQGRKLAGDGKVISYSRFVMHSINSEQEVVFMDNIANEIRCGELVYFEFRSKEDSYLQKTFGNHYRRFVDTSKFIKDMESRGFIVNYSITGQGMARYKNEDPFVSRLIFEKA